MAGVCLIDTRFLCFGTVIRSDEPGTRLATVPGATGSVLSFSFSSET